MAILRMMDPIKYLEENNIKYVLYEHLPVFTVEESSKICSHIPGMHCKNLFMKDDIGKYYLVVMNAHKRLDIKSLEKELGVKKLRFGTEKELWENLRLKPGSVSPLGLINDVEKKVVLIVQKEVWDAEEVSFHPNDNKFTVVVKKDNFHRLVDGMGNERMILEL